MIITFPSADYEVIAYPGGEFQVRLTAKTLDAVRESKTVTIMATAPRSEDAMKLALMANAIRGAATGALSMNLAMPYLPYARGDRRFVPGDCDGLATFGRLINTCGFDEVSVLDVHNAMAAAKAIHDLKNVEPVAIIQSAIEDFERKSAKRASILFPDAGADARYRTMLSGLDRNFIAASKKRDPATGKLSAFEHPGIDKYAPVLIVDDLCDGGGTFIGLADSIGHRPETLGLYVTHSIFSRGIDVLKQRFGRIYTTNSFPVSSELRDGVTVYDAFKYMGIMTKPLRWRRIVRQTTAPPRSGTPERWPAALPWDAKGFR